MIEMKVYGFIYIHYVMKMKGLDPWRESDMTWMGIVGLGIGRFNMTQHAKLVI